MNQFSTLAKLDTLSKDLSLVLKFHAHRSVRRENFPRQVPRVCRSHCGCTVSCLFSAKFLTAQSLNGAIVHGPICLIHMPCRDHHYRPYLELQSTECCLRGLWSTGGGKSEKQLLVPTSVCKRVSCKAPSALLPCRNASLWAESDLHLCVGIKRNAKVLDTSRPFTSPETSKIGLRQLWTTQNMCKRSQW